MSPNKQPHLQTSTWLGADGRAFAPFPAPRTLLLNLSVSEMSGGLQIAMQHYAIRIRANENFMDATKCG